MQSRSPLFSKVDSQSSSGHARTPHQEDLMGSHNSSFDVNNGHNEHHQNYDLSEEEDTSEQLRNQEESKSLEASNGGDSNSRNQLPDMWNHTEAKHGDGYFIFGAHPKTSSSP